MLKLVGSEYFYYTSSPDAIIDLNTVKNLYYSDSITDKITLQKMVILLNRNNTSSKIFSERALRNPKEFFYAMRFVTQNSLFSNIFNNYSNFDFLFGGELSSNHINQGSYFDGFKPNLTITTSLLRKDETTFRMRTGRDFEDNMRSVILINQANVYNSFSDVLNFDEYESIPVANFDSTRILPSTNDGFQNSDSNKVFHYLDRISGRMFRFESKRNTDKNGLYCKMYELDDDVNVANETSSNRYQEFASIYSKSNKNIVVSASNPFKSRTLRNDFISVVEAATNKTFSQPEEDTYFCFDSYSDYLINSEVKLLYSFYTNATRIFLPSFPENALIPVAKYSRIVNLDENKFNSIFSGVKKFDDLRTFFITTGIILSIVFIAVSVLLYIRYSNLKKIRQDSKLIDDLDSQNTKKKNLIR